MESEKDFTLSPGLGEKRWKVYGRDDHDQERYLGCVAYREGKYYALDLPTPVAVKKIFATKEEAARAVYEECLASGFLEMGHPNYLKDQEGRRTKQ